MLVRIAASLLCALTLAGFLGRVHWFFDTWSHFRVQYFLALGVCLAFLLVPRDWLFVGLAGACFALNAAEIAPLYVGERAAAVDETAPRLKLLHANVYEDNRKPERFLALIEESDPDVIVVIEATPAWVKTLEPLAEDYPHSIAEVRDNAFGIALYSRLPLVDAGIVTYGRAGKPSILAAVELDGTRIALLATHPVPPFRPHHWRLRNEQLEAIAAARGELGDRLIIAGDFNTSPFSPCLKHFVAAMSTPESKLRWAGRGFGFKPTWPTFNRLMFTPIDHIYMTDNLAVTEFRTGPHIGSDHLPIQATIALSE